MVDVMVEKVLKDPNYQDQSLEQILNNIKEVITNHSPDTDVLELTDRILDSTDSSKVKVENASQARHTTKDTSSVGYIGWNDELAKGKRLLSTERLISFKAAKESMKAFKNFLKAKEKHEVEKIALRSGITLEELITELLKPQLSDWLNKNLPDIVNNIVQREIRKLIPKDE